MVKKFWKFSKKTTSICWKIVETFFALILVLTGLLLYRLHTEPVDAMKYIPEIEQELFPPDSGYHLQAEKVVLTSDLSREGLIQIDIEDCFCPTTVFFVILNSTLLLHRWLCPILIWIHYHDSHFL